jgi:Tfp pilus assembly protein PilO
MGFSQREKIFLIGAAVVSLLGWFLLCSPKWREASRLKQELQLMTQRTEGAKGVIEAAEQLKRELDAARLKVRYLDEKILPRRDFTRILEQLAEPTREHKIRIISMKPMEEAKANPDSLYQNLPIEMEIRCRYLDLGRYLEDLKDQPLLLNVETLQIRSEEKEAPILSVHMVLTAYMWRIPGKGKES